MADFDLILTGGTIVNADSMVRADLAVRDGLVAAIGHDLGTAREVVDVAGKLIMPGGIDSHVHLAQGSPFREPHGPKVVMADGFESGTRSAAFGGNTMVMPFCLQQHGQTMREALAAYHALAEGNCYTDTSFHLIVTDPTPALLGQELPALVEEGYSSFKVFMTYEGMALADRQILELLDVARRHNALVMIHAENDDAIRFLTDKLEREGRVAPVYHGASRPIPVEREATHRAVSLAEIVDTKIMIVHVSNRPAMEEIERAQARGLTVLAETCPQYLVLTEQDMARAGMEGAKYVCSPPPRDTASQEAMWEGIEQGIFSVFSSDHCPFRYADVEGKLVPEGRDSFRHVPNGIPGIATRGPILFSEGVSKGRIDPMRFVALTSTNHSRIYGLYPRKGVLAPGADADIAVWDPSQRRTIRHADLFDGCDYSPYEGMEVTGWPVSTLLRGQFVVRDGALVGQRGAGRYIARPMA
ncbi:MAG: dihydropyrimidinase [Proteobacteria bacterium]|nr:dihydropyrimidinase [Pseudomonadota bacterium]